MPSIVEVFELSKKYLLHHQQMIGQATLVETLSRSAKYYSAKFKTLFNKNLHAEEQVEEFWALKNVSFTIERGERFGIIGRNGAGKSTLLKILSRIVEPTGGKVIIKGKITSLLEVGTGFHPELTGRENIYLNGAILGMSRSEIKRKFDQIVAFSEVDKFLDIPVKRYSSGMYTRLGFAIAAHLDPEVLIVDEVLAVGDYLFQDKCLKKLTDLGAQGKTIIFVSHDINSMLKICQKGLFLESGMVKCFGSMKTCAEAYMH